ncbi:MAG: HPr family phosphocarrier protein [Lachnospiraceae bacterium]|nr:HPr family phosphocarrier protein [Lachnospiraceae bacterium]
MTSRTICVGNNVTDISMTSAQFVQKACEFESSVLVEVGKKTYINGKSLMGMLSLNMYNGMELHIISEGADEEKAVESLKTLINGVCA